MPEMFIKGVHKRHIVTAYREDGGVYRYMAETMEDAQSQERIFSDMGLTRVSIRSVIWDTHRNVIV